MAKVETGIRVVLAFHDAFNHQDIPGMMRWLNEDIVLEHFSLPPDEAGCKGKEAVSQFWIDFFQKAPGWRASTEEAFGLGLRCVVRWKNDYRPQEGQSGPARGVNLFKIKDGLICEILIYVV